MITRRMRIRLLPVAALAVALLCALAARGQDKASGAKTVVVPRTHIQVDEKSGTVTVTETPQVSQPGQGGAMSGTTTSGTAPTGTAPRARITEKDCRRVVRHQARADVTYKPGVDVRGKPVAPADMAGGFTIPLPDVFEFNVTKDLRAYLDGPAEQLAADKAAALAAQKATTATDAAVASAKLSAEGAQTAYDTKKTAATNAQTAYEAAQAAADAAPTDNTLKTAAETALATATTAQAAADSAASSLATANTAYTATQTAANTGDYSTALTQAQATLTAAKAAGYTQDATAETASTTATTTASAATSAHTAALTAQETVQKSANMELNIGTVRYNINTGAMTFNGKPINDAAMGDLAAICQEMLAAKKR